MSTPATSLARDEKSEISGWVRGWRVWLIVWTVLVNLLTLFMAFLAFGKLVSPFETLVISLLILIYLTVKSIGVQHLRAYVEESWVVRSYLLGLYEGLLHQNISVDSDYINAAREKYQSSTPRYYVNATGDFLMFLLTAWHLIDTLVLH